MRKYIQKELIYNKSLKLTEETFKEIENLYKELGAETDYSIWTENDIYCSFDNLEDLLQYNLEKQTLNLNLKLIMVVFLLCMVQFVDVIILLQMKI